MRWRTRLNCTVLEDRTTPANFVVDLAIDQDNGNVVAGDVSLREAIKLANTTTGADTITFSPTVFNSPKTMVLTLGRINITDSLTITGPGANRLVLDAFYASQIFYVDGGAVENAKTITLEGLTLLHGKTTSVPTADYNGGALSSRNARLRLLNMSLSSSSSAGFGGGMYVQGGTTTVLNSNILLSSSKLNGGGCYSENAQAQMINVTVAQNTTQVAGGGIYCYNGSLVATNCTIVNNNSNSADVSATYTGGGLYNSSNEITVLNTIIARNYRGSSTSILDDVGGPSAFANASSNNLIYNAATAGGLTNGANNNIVGLDPVLGVFQDNGGQTITYAVGQNSPALGKGSATVLNYVPYDQRGTPRDTGTPDIGAYEVQHPLATVGAPIDFVHLYSPKPSLSANEAFVKGLYQSTLLRSADNAGLAGWVNALAMGTSRATVASGFVNSTENRRNQVTFFYGYFLKRAPDTAGLNGWVQQLQSGVDEGTVMANFLLSAEFSASNNNTQFVNLMYYAILSRPADSAGLNGWLNQLNSGTSRAAVVSGFLRSVEGYNRVTTSFFGTYLERTPDSTTLSNFVSYFSNHTFGQAATLILSGDEFFNNAAANV
jgi:Domain of unknown function (DUF4214)